MKGGAKIYKTVDGARVPSVTTVLKMLGLSTEGLVRWAHRIGEQGISLDEARESSASVGTIAHAMIEAEIKGESLRLDGVDPTMLEKARQAFEMWRDWARRTGYKPIAAETSLVSETHRFGGTFDCVAISGTSTIIDWKTSAGIYAEHLLQIAAYGVLWQETHPEQPIESYGLLRLDRDRPHFEYRLYSDLDDATDAFLRLRQLYDIVKRVQKAA